MKILKVLGFSFLAFTGMAQFASATNAMSTNTNPSKSTKASLNSRLAQEEAAITADVNWNSPSIVPAVTITAKKDKHKNHKAKHADKVKSPRKHAMKSKAPISKTPISHTKPNAYPNPKRN
jgi:hypothetical protein